MQNRVGGGEGVEGLYGSVACKGTTDIVDCMRDECGLDSSSRLVDIGAGLGRCGILHDQRPACLACAICKLLAGLRIVWILIALMWLMCMTDDWRTHFVGRR